MPLGYDAKDRTLVVNEAEAQTVVTSAAAGRQSRLYPGGRYSPRHETGLHHFHCAAGQTESPTFFVWSAADVLSAPLQRVQIDDEEAPDDVGSLAASAEALRLTAAAPPRNQNLGADYDG